MSKLQNIFRNMDFFGATFSFHINESTAIKTTAGGILSFLTFLFFIFTFIAFGNDFYHKKNPKLLIQEMVNSNETLYMLNNYTIPDETIVVKVDKKLDSVTSFVIEAYLPYNGNTINYPFKTLQLCNTDYVLNTFYMSNSTIGYYEMEKKYTYYCFDLSEYKVGLISSEGWLGDINVNTITIWSFNCGKSALGVYGKDCPSTFKPDGSYKGNVEIWTNITLYNPDNIEQPFQKTLKRISKSGLSKTSSIDVYAYISSHENHDNDGFLMNTDNVKTVYSIDSADTAIATRDTQSNYYDLTLHIGYTRVFKKYTRTYMKIQDLLAQVGGVIKAIFTIFQILNYFFNEFYLDQYILSLTDSSVFKTKSHIINTIKKNEKNPTKDLDKTTKDASIAKLQINNDTKVNNFTDLSKNNLSKSLSYRSYLSILFFCQSSSVKKTKAYLIRLTSFETYLSLYHQFTNLKQMLLNKTQDKAFDYIDAPYNEPTIYDSKTLKELKEYFNNKHNTKSENDYDRFIYEKISTKLDI